MRASEDLMNLSQGIIGPLEGVMRSLGDLMGLLKGLMRPLEGP